MPIKLDIETEKRMRSSIKHFFSEKIEDEIGDLKAGLVLEYFLKELAPTVYNQAVSDAQRHLTSVVVDLNGVCYEDEFGYWTRNPKHGS